MSLANNNFPNYGSTGSDMDGRPRSSSDISLYNQLCDNISSNIVSINNNVTALESFGKEIGANVDSNALNDKIHGYRERTNQLIGTTTRFVKELHRLVQKGVTKENRFQAKRLENDFQETVKRYDVLQKQLVPKMKQALLTSSTDNKITPNVWGVGGYEDEAQAAENEEQQMKQQSQQLLHAELELEHGLLLEREARIRQIESDILDVNETFRELGTIVHEQGDMIGTIEENIASTAHHVETGTQQLSKAEEYQKKYRNKLCWFIMILLIVSTIIAIVIYVETR